MRRFRRFRFSVAGWVRWAVLLGACAYLFVRLVDALVLGPLAAAAEMEARQRGIEAVNRVLFGSVSASLRHEDLIQYVKDEQGRIAAYNVNTREVTRVAHQAARAIQDEFLREGTRTFQLPLGALLGSDLFSASGPRVPVRMIPIGAVRIDVLDRFQSEGINQTRHAIWFRAVADVQVVLPFISRPVKVTVDLPVTETVIVGPVPDGFFGGNMGGVTVPVNP